MTDHNKPALSDTYTDVLNTLKQRIVESSIMFRTGTFTNLPTGTIRYNSSLDRFESWDGAAWTAILAAVNAHLARTDNPHATTAVQVGAAALIDFNNHVASQSNPHNVTAAQLGAVTSASFNAHVASVNPHNTTAASVGALAISSNLSELSASAATARNNIGAASAATLSSHVGSTSNPHATTAAQVGAVAISNNLSELSATANSARFNIGAAKNGINDDITQLTTCSLVQANGETGLRSVTDRILFSPNNSPRWQMVAAGHLIPVTSSLDVGSSGSPVRDVWVSGKVKSSGGPLVLEAPTSQAIIVAPVEVQCWKFDVSGDLLPMLSTGSRNIGSDAAPVEKVFASQKFRWKGTTKGWTFASYTTRTTLNPASATAQQCADAINTIARYLDDIGLLN